MKFVQAVLISFIIFTITSCFLTPKKKGGGGRGKKSCRVTNLLKTDSLFIDRFGTGDKARFKFETTKQVNCEIRLYSQEKERDQSGDQTGMG